MRFDELPLSFRTQQSLQLAKLQVATEIQAAAIPHALAGRDILGAAKTGSGKTLSFVIPLLEKLFVEKWSPEDGLGALIITPTRELALQIFEVLRTVGKKHTFSAGLVTGGKKEFNEEQERIVRMNILVSTPGRLLQHFEQTQGFDASHLLMLVLDEADRILDMGFAQQLDAILNYLPSERQTMLFSATQTKSVKDLARLSLRDPEFLAVHAEAAEVTPAQLVQNYVIVPLDKKLDTLYSFLKTHVKSKIIVFFSTCSQARYVYEAFCGLQPGLPLTALHGKVKQEKRTIIYMDFLRKPAACMFATDIAARGLDFPSVDWVIQVDAPEDAAMYIHRVGRTARYTAAGRALLFLMPNEESTVLPVLKAANIPIKKLTVNPHRAFSIAAKAAALLASHTDFNTFAKKAFVGYLRSLQLLPHYPLKDVSSLPLDAFAVSLGLAFTPDLPFADKSSKEADEDREVVREKKNVNRALDKLKKQIAEAKEERKRAKQVAKLEAAGRTEEAEALKAQKTAKVAIREEDSETDDFLTVKQVHNPDENDEALSLPQTAADTKIKAKKLNKISKDGNVRAVVATTKRLVFDEDGNAITRTGLVNNSEAAEKDALQERIASRLDALKSSVDAGRADDILRDKARLREKRLKEKIAARAPKAEDEDYSGDEDAGVQLAGAESEDDEDSGDSGSDGEEDDESEDEHTDEEQDSDAGSGSEDEDDFEEEEEEPAPVAGKKKRSLQDSIREQEELALSMLEGKRAKLK